MLIYRYKGRTLTINLITNDNIMTKTKRYLTNLKMDSFLAVSIAEGFCGGEDATDDERHDAWQYLVDTGQAYKLQGWFGRTAESLIEAGLIQKAKTQ